MSIHEPPLRAFIQEGRAVERVVRLAIREHQDGCPWRAIVKALPCTLSCRGAAERQEPEGRPVPQPELLVVEDLSVVQGVASRTLGRGGAARPPVPTNLVALLDPDRLLYIRQVAMDKRAEHLLEGDAWVIRVNGALGRKARRFAIMSQGFHVVRRSRNLELRSCGSAALDWLADRFASYVLMPEGWVRELWPRVENVAVLAGIFDVSPTAMRIRLKELGLLGIVEAGRG